MSHYIFKLFWLVGMFSLIIALFSKIYLFWENIDYLTKNKKLAFLQITSIVIICSEDLHLQSYKSYFFINPISILLCESPKSLASRHSSYTEPWKSKCLNRSRLLLHRNLLSIALITCAASVKLSVFHLCSVILSCFLMG